MFCLINFFLFP